MAIKILTDMANFNLPQTSNHEAVADIYTLCYDQLYRYVKSRVNDADDAYDLVQEVFLRLLEHTGLLLKEGVKGLAYAIAGNVVNDYLRHHYVRTSVHASIYESGCELTNETEDEVIGRDLERLEKESLEAMPRQRKLIYMMRVHEGKTTKEIAEQLNISTRTAENHFYIGIREMRACFSHAI